MSLRTPESVAPLHQSKVNLLPQMGASGRIVEATSNVHTIASASTAATGQTPLLWSICGIKFARANVYQIARRQHEPLQIAL